MRASRPLATRKLKRVSTALIAGVCAASLLSVPVSADAGPTYLDAKASTNTRVADLLRRMTVEEKVGQLQQIAVTRLQGDSCTWSGGELNETCMREVLAEQKAGSILSGGGMGPPTNTPKAWAEMTNAIQRYAIENTRLRIPIVYGVDAVHGHNNVLGATVFPHQLGLGATWNPELVRSSAQSTQRAIAATGSPWNFSPVAEIARDQRWGRYYETYSEDPLLAGDLAAASVRGYQDRSSGARAAATVKHFAGYSEPGNGHDRVPGDMSARYLQDTILPSYKAALDAGALTVMANSGALNGVPVTASKYLLTDVLRRQWRFDGLVVSDWNDVRSLQTAYKIVPDYPTAVAKAINAGVDMAMLPPDDRDFHAAALTAVRRGLISKRRLDEAVGRVLTLKYRLGLFERPYVDPAAADGIVLRADQQLAQRAAAESLVLLRNENGVLPLRGSKIVVTGPSADSMPNQVGGWTIGWQGVPDGVTVPGTTILQGLRSGAPEGTTITHAPALDDAVAQTRTADAAVVVVGEKPGAEGPADAPRPELAADQVALVKALQATGKPVVVVVVSGRPLILREAATTAGLLAAWLPGNEGGTAVADVLYGRFNPSGRLPVSWPKELGNDPVYYQQLPGTNGGPDSGYSPLFPFGAGLSYTDFAISGVAVERVSRREVQFTVNVANNGARAGDLVVPVYVGQPVSEVLAPPKRLVAYTKVALAPGQTRTLRLSFPLSRLAVTGGDVDGSGRPHVEPGVYRLFAGNTQTDFTVR